MTRPSGISRTFAELIVDTTWERLPERVRHEAKRSILNFMATALAGCREDAVEHTLASLAAFSGVEQATVIGRTERLDALSAAFLNAASGNVFDFDDTHLRTVIHPTAPILPALFALAELRSVSGRELLLAFALGVEIECRVGNAISPEHYARGWHITSTCGCLGAAAAAGKLLSLDADQLIWSLGSAATQTGGLVECLGTPAKSLSVGNAARNGLWSALLAERGFRGPPAPLEGKQGYFNALAPSAPDWSALTRELGETWELLQNTYKPYPAGIVVHPVIDAVLALRQEHVLAPDNIERIVVRGHPLLAARTDRPHVTSGREAQVSVQHSVAAALLFGEACLAQYTDTCVRDPAALALRAKVQVERDAGIAVEAAALRIEMKDGTVHALAVPAARGSLARPLSDSEIEEKLHRLAAGWCPTHDVQPLIDAVWALDRAADAAAVPRLTVPTI
ncbi:MmgE/PrpD family protein [Hyphomicrobium sp. CS1BSMeth3]|uniref:MmgE/PrpD family protein n=1 Tax=Hyphomicrobium sp. CS1BSMeth3 TaxID=1892844 RepID=UPI0009309EE3|nr:MmgE/PrpD family protein [Hyphomicrobium sp. CS1BSMeth3]